MEFVFPGIFEFSITIKHYRNKPPFSFSPPSWFVRIVGYKVEIIFVIIFNKWSSEVVKSLEFKFILLSLLEGLVDCTF